MPTRDVITAGPPLAVAIRAAVHLMSTIKNRLSTNSGILRPLIEKAGLDQAIVFTLLTKAWQALAGLVSLLLIAQFFTPEIQGFYYTFSSLLALQAVADRPIPDSLRSHVHVELLPCARETRGSLMRLELLEVLACPKCQGGFVCHSRTTEAEGDVLEGLLACEQCGSEFRVARGIPRFVDDGNYAATFGYQWNLFRAEQIDSVNGTELSARRFFGETGWDA